MVALKGFLTNLGKYNEGHLVGKWVTFPIDETELKDVFAEIGIDDAIHGEYFFTNYDYEGLSNLGLGERTSVDRLNEIADFLNELNESGDIMAFNAMCELNGAECALEYDYEDVYLYPDIKTDYDLGYYYAEESGIYNLEAMGTLANYIDYERFGRDIRFDSNGGMSSYGWIEYF